MATIKEYLEQVRAAGGVPTFTNIGGENPMLQPGPGRPMGGAQRPGAHLIEEQNQPMMGPGGEVARAIPEQDQPQVDQNDPWALAQSATKAMLPDVWQRVFPGMAPGANLTEAQMMLWQKSVQSTRNAMVDRFKYQLDSVRKDKELKYKKDLATGKAEMKGELTTKDRANYLNDYLKEYKKKTNKLDVENYDAQVAAQPAQEWAKKQLADLEAALGGSAIPGEGEGLPAGQPTPGEGMVGQERYQGRTAAPGVPSGPSGEAPTIEQFQADIRALSAKYGLTPDGKKRAIEELKVKYPMINLP